jgi:hypothetical protein
VTVVAGAAGASAGGGTSTLLLSLGVSMLSEAAILAPRALSTGLPFAASSKKSDGRQSSRARSRPLVTSRLAAMAPPPQRQASSRMGDVVYEPAPYSLRGGHHHHDHHHRHGLAGPSDVHRGTGQAREPLPL